MDFWRSEVRQNGYRQTVEVPLCKYAYWSMKLLYLNSARNRSSVALLLLCRLHAPTKQPRQPFLSQSAMRGSHVLACNGVRLTSQLKWRKVGQPPRVIPCIDCAMLSQYFAYCTVTTIGSYNITVLNCYNCLFIYFWQTMAYGCQPTQPAKDIKGEPELTDPFNLLMS